MPRLSTSKVVTVKDERRCYGCGKMLPKGTKMLSQKYFPDGPRDHDFQRPLTIHVEKDCLNYPPHIALFEGIK